MSGSPSPFSVSIDQLGRAAVVEVEGALDISTASQLGRALESLVARAPELTVGLERVWFVDAGAARRLLRTQHRVQACGGRLTLTGASTQVRRVLLDTGLDAA